MEGTWRYLWREQWKHEKGRIENLSWTQNEDGNYVKIEIEGEGNRNGWLFLLIPYLNYNSDFVRKVRHAMSESEWHHCCWSSHSPFTILANGNLLFNIHLTRLWTGTNLCPILPTSSALSTPPQFSITSSNPIPYNKKKKIWLERDFIFYFF